MSNNTEENIINNETLGNPEAVKVKRTKQLYAIFDRARMAYLGIMEKPNMRCALRDFEQLATSDQSLIKRTPEDFAMYKIGEFDEESGELINDKQKIAEATEYVGKEIK